MFRHNLVIVCPSFTPSAGSTSATVRNYVKTSNGDSEIAKVIIFDLHNKLIAYSGTFRDGIRDVTYQWGGIFLFGADKLSRLDENSTSAKLEVLYRRNLYTLAISLARSQGIGEAGLADIRRRYGDYLYGKGDFDGAMGQFVKTLGYLQPSYVIRNVSDHMNSLIPVSRRSTDTQPHDLPPRASLPRSGEPRPHDPPAQLLHQDFRPRPPRHLHQN